MDFLQYIDTRLLLTVNEARSPFLDEVMWWVSGNYTWIPLYMVLIWIVIKKFGKQSVSILLLILPLVLVSDVAVSRVSKNTFQRLRPSHDPEVSPMLHYVHEYRGGQYGFVSAHSMNVFSLSFYLFFAVGKKIRWIPFVLFPWAILVAYSRIYLGVHYPSDVLVPVILAAPIGWILSRINERIVNHYFPSHPSPVIQ